MTWGLLLLAAIFILIGVRWLFDAHRILLAALKTEEPGPALRLANSRADLRRRRAKAAKGAAAQSEHAANCLHELYGSANTDAWISPTILSWFGALVALAVTGFITYYFNKSTLQMTRGEVLAFGWGTPAAIISTHVCLTARKLSWPTLLLKIAQDTEKLLKRAFVALVLAAVCFSVAKLISTLPPWASPATLWLLEATMSCVSSAAVVLALAHSQAPFAMARSDWLSACAENYGGAMRILADRCGLDVATLWPTTPEPPPSPGPTGSPANGAPPASTATTNGDSPPKSATRRSRDDLPYMPAVLLAALLLIGHQGSARAATLHVSYIVDTTASVFRGDVAQAISLAHEQTLAYARGTDDRVEISLCPWTGGPLATRHSQHFLLDSLAFTCRSVFKLACDHERALARTHRDSLRAPVIARFELAMNRLEAAMAFNPVPNSGSCIGSLASGGDAQAALGLSVVITDGVLEGCDQQIAHAMHGSRCIFIVCARVADGDAAVEKASERTAALRALGYNAVDGPDGARALDWPALFTLATSPGK